MNRIWNKSHRNNCSLLMILLLGFILWQTPVHASEFNFAVDFELPANQIDKNKTYINVRMEPGKTQEIPYTVFNRTDKSVTVETLIHSATTNSNGVIEYGESKSKFDETLSYDMKNLAKTVGEITVPPQSAVTETLSLKAPEKELAGVVAGGITFQEKKENVSNKSTVGVVNQFSQVKAT
ncbi:cell surface protein [Enterococcus faecium E1071]|nr:cell surface protein [Enterococcus faecium E1071]